MFWSKTKDVVHNFTKESSCYVTVEETLLGSVLDGLTWCGKEGSNGETPPPRRIYRKRLRDQRTRNEEQRQ